jgi:glycosyltransferase involved in cell wall biosynthesis
MPSDSRPFVSVIIPCRNEERFIASCLDSILQGDYPKERLEVIVIDGRSNDRTSWILTQYSHRYPQIRILDNPRRITPAALNIGLRAARGEVIARADAHAIYPTSYLSLLVSALKETGADSVGGVIETRPGADTTVARAIALAMSHPLGVGNSHFRVGSTTRRTVDHVPFFCCRKEVFDRLGGFDEELIRNQDGEFSTRLICQGGRIVLIPEVVSQYFARDTMGKLARMFYQYGYFKVLTTRKVGRVMTVRQVVPAALMLSLASTGLASFWASLAGVLFLGILAAYASLVTIFALRSASAVGLRTAIVLGATFPVMHFAYGFGSLRRAVELLVRRGSPQSSPELVPLSR